MCKKERRRRRGRTKKTPPELKQQTRELLARLGERNQTRGNDKAGWMSGWMDG